MQIVDAQIHLWGSGLPSNLSHRQVTSFTPEEAIALMDEGGVDAAVIHPPGWDPNSTEMAFAAVREILPAGSRSWVQCRSTGRNRAAASPGGESNPGCSGCVMGSSTIRRGNGFVTERSTGCGRRLKRPGFPIAMLATDSLSEIGRIAERHPGLRLTIDHLGGRGGTSTLKDAAAMTHMPALLALAKFPNVAVKATGVPHYSSEAYPFPALHPFLRQVYDAFGPNRMFWGTDISKMPCSWRQCVTMFTEELPWLKGRDLELVMGEALCAWWGWNRAG